MWKLLWLLKISATYKQQQHRMSKNILTCDGEDIHHRAGWRATAGARGRDGSKGDWLAGRSPNGSMRWLHLLLPRFRQIHPFPHVSRADPPRPMAPHLLLPCLHRWLHSDPNQRRMTAEGWRSRRLIGDGWGGDGEHGGGWPERPTGRAWRRRRRGCARSCVGNRKGIVPDLIF